MNANRQTVNSEPQLSIVDGSGIDSVRFFNTLAKDEPGILRSIIMSDSVIKETPPPSQEASDAKIAQATTALRGLLKFAHNGKRIDYDGDTWSNLMQDDGYMKEAYALRGMSERDPGLEDQRRKVTATGLGIYATRLLIFEAQEAEEDEAKPDATEALMQEAHAEDVMALVDPLPDIA